MNYSRKSFAPYCHGRPQWMELAWSSYRTLQQANTSARSNNLKLLKKLNLEDILPQTLCVVCLTGNTWYRWQLTEEGRRVSGLMCETEDLQFKNTAELWSFVLNSFVVLLWMLSGLMGGLTLNVTVMIVWWFPFSEEVNVCTKHFW